MQNSESSSDELKNQSQDESAAAGHDLQHKLNVTGWALFFIWIGIAYLANFTVSIGLLGIGIITLVMQAVRKQYKLKAEGFWVIVGILFVLAGLWEVFKADFPLVPIVLIIAGITLLVSMLRKKK